MRLMVTVATPSCCAASRCDLWKYWAISSVVKSKTTRLLRTFLLGLAPGWVRVLVGEMVGEAKCNGDSAGVNRNVLTVGSWRNDAAEPQCSGCATLSVLQAERGMLLIIARRCGDGDG